MRGGSEDKVLRACHKICYRLTTAAFLGKESFCVQRSWRRSRAWSPPMKFSWRRGGGAFHLGSTVPWLRKLAHVDWNGLAARHGSYSMFLPCFYMYYVTLYFMHALRSSVQPPRAPKALGACSTTWEKRRPFGFECAQYCCGWAALKWTNCKLQRRRTCEKI